MVYVSYSIYTLSVYTMYAHTHTHTTLSFIVLVKAICSHIRNLGLQNGNRQRDQVQIVCFSALLPILVKCGKYTTDKDVERTHLIASHCSLKHLLKVEHKVSINDYPIILFLSSYILPCKQIVILRERHGPANIVKKSHLARDPSMTTEHWTA